MIKGRSSTTYQRKLDKTKKWYSIRIEARKQLEKQVQVLSQKEELTKEDQRLIKKHKNSKSLKSLEYYTEKLKQSNSNR